MYSRTENIINTIPIKYVNSHALPSLPFSYLIITIHYVNVFFYMENFNTGQNFSIVNTVNFNNCIIKLKGRTPQHKTFGQNDTA